MLVLHTELATARIAVPHARLHPYAPLGFIVPRGGVIFQRSGAGVGKRFRLIES